MMNNLKNIIMYKNNIIKYCNIYKKYPSNNTVYKGKNIYN